MRLAVAVAAVAAALLLPIAAAANPARCQQLDRQIQHYQGMVERAQDLDNEMWEQRTQRQVALLMGQRAQLGCPVPVEDAAFHQAFVQLLTIAGQAALTYFTFGAL